MGYRTQNKNFHIHTSLFFLLPHTMPHLLLSNPAIELESFYLMQSHWFWSPRANVNRTVYRSFNDFHLPRDRNQMVKRIKQKGSKTQWHPRVTAGWLQPGLALQRFSSAAAGADGSPVGGSAKPRGCTGTPGSPEGAAGAPNGAARGTGLRSQPPHPGQLLPSAFKEKQLLLESLCRNLPIPSAIQLLKGMTLSLPGGIWCKFYISPLC